MNSRASDYLSLTKPRISMLFAFSGATALVLEGSVKASSLRFWLITFAIFAVGGAANALNQYFERDIDKKMKRTAEKRALPSGRLSPRAALIFALVLGILGNVLLLATGNLLAMGLGVATIAYYSFYYTLWLKPRTPYNIVIGGAAGATGPLIAWAAVAGNISWLALFMFLIIFFWTPPHFWALALCCKQDYANAGYPMLPNVAGDEVTKKNIFFYSLALLPIAVAPSFFGLHKFYAITSSLLSLAFLYLAFRISKTQDLKEAWKLFGYSILYLFLILLMMIIDVAVS
ncbi:MAG: protoheme IX farnesyltransferase [Deltaproteobacteria bacterium CG_4_10_14_0_2_um_filter_43_8]|nr:MAG: protoheme IX farnesyltransferase [Deltaproteobacteria bacterium CG11_big_fil_rev_8_21_14_0_20_42_23]PJA22166.1 MAG: protoheme IX farnesyltransferase [Deltaproteobacteria bacterium CG_4_10_14_0_2_um_filter_43_8]PJC65083.1 MAG: protoheme IX farnesyltransferase [Deltaproteobacteria bacterium CG_4_9_14_0_2_um_filter_42_21]